MNKIFWKDVAPNKIFVKSLPCFDVGGKDLSRLGHLFTSSIQAVETTYVSVGVLISKTMLDAGNVKMTRSSHYLTSSIERKKVFWHNLVQASLGDVSMVGVRYLTYVDQKLVKNSMPEHRELVRVEGLSRSGYLYTSSVERRQKTQTTYTSVGIFS